MPAWGPWTYKQENGKGEMPRTPEVKYTYGPPTIDWNAPQWPRVGPKEPRPLSGNYESQVDTKPFGAIDPGMAYALRRVSNPFRTFDAVGRMAGMVTGGSAGTAGDQTRAAFSRGMTDTSRNALRRATDKFNTEYTAQAEKARAEDIKAQRMNADDRFQMDVNNAIFREGRKTQAKADWEEIRAYARREIENAKAKIASSLLGLI